MSSDVNAPGAREVTFDQVYQTYREQIKALNQGGVHLYLIETITDTLNCKAAVKATIDLEAEGLENFQSGSLGLSQTDLGAPYQVKPWKLFGILFATPNRLQWDLIVRWAQI